MPSIKDYNDKIARLKNTRKMTRTMKLVSMSKLNKAQEAQRRSKPYRERLTDLISRLAATIDATNHPLLNSEGNQKNALVLLVTSDRGLCGGFNNNLVRQVNAWAIENKKNYENIDFSFCGRRGFLALRNRYKTRDEFEHMTAKPEFASAKKIGAAISEHFLNGEYKDVYIAYNRFISPLSQKPQIEKLLPIEPKPLFQPVDKLPTGYIMEPKGEELLSFLIPKYLFFMIFYTLLENSAGEHGARMIAMDSATKNAEELISSFTLRRNRARQADITGELIEIISGSEALNS